MFRVLAILLFSFALLNSTGCRRDIQIDEDPDAQLLFSRDTIVFDTVFTTVGSTSRVFKVFNTSSKAVNIESIVLAGGSTSPFRINVDGTPVISTGDILLRGGDSMFVFVDVTLDPNNGTNPLMIEDSIIFITNGNRQKVVLNAVGQDAYFHYYETSGCGEIWLTDKPHVVYGWVVVPSCCKLTIPAGADVYMHHNAVIAADSCATLEILGSSGSPVKIQGDRLEPEYEDEPGQWGYIWLSSLSKDNKIEWAVIKNGTIGVLSDSLGATSNPTVQISNTIIRNMSLAGIYGRTSHIEGENILVENCAQYCVAIAYGGRCKFRHCTFANYWNIDNRTTPALVLNNWYKVDEVTFNRRDLTQADFLNCIIYGDKDVEVGLDSLTTGGEIFNYFFANCVIRTDQPTSNTNHFNTFTQSRVNNDPAFTSIADHDFHIGLSSSAKDLGDAVYVGQSPAIPNDLDNISRLADSGPDAGCYEAQ